MIPNGVLVPESRARRRDASTASSSPGGTSRGRALQVLLRAWPEIRRRTGLRLTVAGADPLAVRLLLTRLGVADDGIDVVGFLSQEELTETLLGAKALVAPSLGQESFGMVLTRGVRVRAPGRRVRHSRATARCSTRRRPSRCRRATPSALVGRGLRLVDDEPRRARARRGGARASRSSATRGRTSRAGSSRSTSR